MNALKLSIALVFLLTVPAQGVNLNCTVPTENVARSVELCEELRQRLRVRSSEWNNDICATQFLRIGLMAGERSSSKRTAQATVAALVSTATNLFESTWPRPATAFCGDNQLDTEVPFGEECDDGNNDDGDGCDNSCHIE